MSMLAVATKDFQVGIRSRTLLLVAGLFTAYMVFMTYFLVVMANTDIPTEAADLVRQVSRFVPFVGTLLGYNAIVGERESGSLKFLLGLPHTRRDVVLGKLIGRSALVAVTVIVGFAVVGIHYAMLAESPSFSAYALVTGKMIILGIVFVAIAIAFSMTARSTTIAALGPIGIAVLFTFLWDWIFLALFVNLNRADWTYLLERLNPRHAIRDASVWETGIGPEPFYVDPWFGVVILGGWLVVPLGLAYLRFQRGDLA